MATRQQASSGAQRQRSIDSDRFERALTETMTVEFTGLGFADVEHDGAIYEVELVGGACECADYIHRGDRLVCKHVIRASLATVFAEKQHNSELAARAARYAREAGCPHGIDDCNGPTCGADRPDGLPCQGCVEAVKSDEADEWAVWNAPGARSVRRKAQAQVRTDGGEDQ